MLLAATAGVVDDFANEMTVLRSEVQQLRGAMGTRAPIEQARGMLMMRYGLSADRALQLLLQWSKAQGVDVRVLAVCLVNLGVDEGGVVPEQQIAPHPARFERSTSRAGDPADAQ